MRALNRVFRAKTINTQRRGVAFSIRQLFANSEPGVWYDPSDLSTLFQDSAGKTPVTAVEQPVGLMLDKSKGQGSELVTNGTFDTDISGWVASPQFPSSSAVEWSNGSLHVYNTQANYGESRSAAIPLTIGKRYVLEMEILAGTTASYWIIIGSSASNDSDGRIVVTSESSGTSPSGYKRWRYSFVASYATAYLYFATNKVSGSHLYADNVSVRELPGNHAYQTTATSRPVLSARVNQYLATETLATQNVTTLAAQYLLSFEGTGTITLSGTATGVYSAGSHLITCTAGTLTSTVSGSATKADLRVANDGANLPPYQRVNTATDYDTVGFPHYLRFDGVDDWLVTNTITPGIDKVQVFAGVRKLNTTQSVIEEFGNVGASNGGFGLFSERLADRTYSALSRGTSLVNADSGLIIAPPTTNVLTGLGDISGDSAILRVNGTQAASSTSDQGTGNYLAYPLYIGRRGGTTLPFNGQLYSLIVRFGSNLPAATIEKTEKYINGLTKAY